MVLYNDNVKKMHLYSFSLIWADIPFAQKPGHTISIGISVPINEKR